jgi:ribose transport system substrate-binding protein
MAKALLAALEKRPTELPVTAPITKPIPKGKRIDWLVCGVPDCTILTKPLQEAAAALGWTIKSIPAGLTPATVQAAWKLAVQDKPDAVMATGFPRAIFNTQLQQLKAMNIPVIDGFVTDEAGDGLTAVVAGGAETFGATGKTLADFTVGRGGKKTNAVFIGGSTFPGLDAVQNAYKTEYKTLCPDCSFDALNEPASAIGTTLPSAVVAYLTKHPNVNYLALGEGSMSIGLPQALQAAHLKAKIVGVYPSQTELQALSAGTIDGIVMFQQGDAMWQMTDALARYFAGVDVADAMKPSPAWAITKDSASELSGRGPYFLIENYQADYKKLWGVS